MINIFVPIPMIGKNHHTVTFTGINFPIFISLLPLADLHCPRDTLPASHMQTIPGKQTEHLAEQNDVKYHRICQIQISVVLALLYGKTTEMTTDVIKKAG